MLENEVNHNKAYAIYEPAKEADLVRHELAEGTISPKTADEETKSIINDVSKHWLEVATPSDEKVRDWRAITSVMHNLPLESQIHLEQEAHRVLTDDKLYKYDLRRVAKLMLKENHNVGRIFGYNPWADSTYAQQQEELKKALSDLPEKEPKPAVPKLTLKGE